MFFTPNPRELALVSVVEKAVELLNDSDFLARCRVAGLPVTAESARAAAIAATASLFAASAGAVSDGPKSDGGLGRLRGGETPPEPLPEQAKRRGRPKRSFA